MRRQIQEVLRKAGEESLEKGTKEEREDLKGVEVSSVQQLYVSVRGVRTSAATNKCEFSTARTYHSVRGALVLNKKTKWCKLCAWAHDKDCEKLRAYRTEEVKCTQELMARTRREAAPTRAQQQAARPEYTLTVEKENR
eukprot:6201166-Pleurochrysis_carterae.AAC.2